MAALKPGDPVKDANGNVGTVLRVVPRLVQNGVVVHETQVFVRWRLPNDIPPIPTS